MSDDLRIAWRNVQQYRRRLLPLALVVVLGSALALTCLGFVAKAAEASTTQITQGIALRTIEISAGAAHPESSPLTTSAVQSLRSVANVVDVQASLQASIAMKNDAVAGALFYATIPRSLSLPPILASVRPSLFPLKPGEIVVPDSSQGTDFTPLLGRTLPASYTVMIGVGAGKPAPMDLTVVGTYDHTYTADGPATTYDNADDVLAWAAARAGAKDAETLLDSRGYDEASVLVDDSANVPAVLRVLGERSFQATSVQQRMSQLPRQVELLRILGFGVVALLLLFSLLSGLSLARSFIAQRTREIGLLKALGFAEGRISRILLTELVLAAAIPAAAGVALGVLASSVAGRLASEHPLFGVEIAQGATLPAPVWILTVALAPILCVALGGLAPARRAAHLDPDVALREWR